MLGLRPVPALRRALLLSACTSLLAGCRGRPTDDRSDGPPPAADGHLFTALPSSYTGVRFANNRVHEETGKPFGVMGISLTDTGEPLLATLRKATFVYFRDGVSARRAQEELGR